MNRRLGNLTLYQVVAESSVLEPLRKKVGRELRISLVFSSVLIILGFTMLFKSNVPGMFRLFFAGMPVFWISNNISQLRRLPSNTAMRLITANRRFIRDRIGFYSFNENVIDYDYRHMLQCTKSQCGLVIEMADGRSLDIPFKAFAHKTDYNSFTYALEVEMNVPVIDLTESEVAGAT